MDKILESDPFCEAKISIIQCEEAEQLESEEILKISGDKIPKSSLLSSSYENSNKT